MTRDGLTLRVGFIGAGFSAHLHAEAYHQVRGVDVKLTRVAAARPARAAQFAKEFGVATVAPLAIKAARAGKHVIIEKPLTGCFAPPSTPRNEMLRRALADSDEIIAACQQAGVRLCYAENWVYAPAHPAGAAPAHRRGRAHSADRRRGEPWRHAEGSGEIEGSPLTLPSPPMGEREAEEPALYLKADEGRRLRGRPVRPRAVMAETALLTEARSMRWLGRRADRAAGAPSGPRRPVWLA